MFDRLCLNSNLNCNAPMRMRKCVSPYPVCCVQSALPAMITNWTIFLRPAIRSNICVNFCFFFALRRCLNWLLLVLLRAFRFGLFYVQVASHTHTHTPSNAEPKQNWPQENWVRLRAKCPQLAGGMKACGKNLWHLFLEMANIWILVWFWLMAKPCYQQEHRPQRGLNVTAVEAAKLQSDSLRSLLVHRGEVAAPHFRHCNREFRVSPSSSARSFVTYLNEYLRLNCSSRSAICNKIVFFFLLAPPPVVACVCACCGLRSRQILHSTICRICFRFW